MNRKTEVKRETKETTISVSLNIDGTGDYSINTPIGFFTHMLESFSKHGSFDLDIKAEGDTHVDQHHLVEDCGIVLGRVFDQALRDRQGINRAGFFIYPMDEALSTAAVDLSGRPYLQYEAEFSRQYCGSMEIALLEDFFRAFSVHARANIVVRITQGGWHPQPMMSPKDIRHKENLRKKTRFSCSVIQGGSDHHKAESAFKALAKALRMACEPDPRNPGRLPTTKGVM